MKDASRLHQWTELEPVAEDPSVVIGLIHGTWDPDAQWCQCGSLLYRAIQKSVTGNPLVCSFTWSGKNSVKERKLAAEALRNKLAESQEKYARTSHMLIGHSHGGNIAIQATAGLPGVNRSESSVSQRRFSMLFLAQILRAWIRSTIPCSAIPSYCWSFSSFSQAH